MPETATGTRVNIDPELSARLEGHEAALHCAAGIAYLVAVLIDREKLSLKGEKATFDFTVVGREAEGLTSEEWDLHPGELERVKETSELWRWGSKLEFQQLGIAGDWATKISIQRDGKGDHEIKFMPDNSGISGWGF